MPTISWRPAWEAGTRPVAEAVRARGERGPYLTEEVHGLGFGSNSAHVPHHFQQPSADRDRRYFLFWRNNFRSITGLRRRHVRSPTASPSAAPASMPGTANTAPVANPMSVVPPTTQQINILPAIFFR